MTPPYCARVRTQDPRKLYWDFFVGAMIVYSMVLIPWRISYRQDASGGMLIFDYFVDAVFGIDIVVCFNAAYFEEVIHRRSRTRAKGYQVPCCTLRRMPQFRA